MRKQLSKTILEIMDKDEKVVVLLGDIGVHAFKDVFEKYPTRCYNIGIFEQSMVGVAAGLAMAGFTPIVHTIEPFLVERAFEQIKDDFGYQELKGTLIGVDVSITAPNLGYTHQTPYALEMMNFVIGMNTFEPNTPEEFDEILKSKYANSLNYIRIR
jgi:transketolase